MPIWIPAATASTVLNPTVGSSFLGQSLLSIRSTKVVPIESNPHFSATSNRDDVSIISSNKESTSTNSNSNDHDSGANENTDNGESKARALQAVIEEAAVAGKKLRFRLLMCTTVPGIILFLGMIAAIIVAMNDASGVPVAIVLAFVFLSLMLTALGIMPNDALTIRIMSVVLSFFMFAGSALTAMWQFDAWFNQRHQVIGYDGESTEQTCAADVPQFHCAVRACCNIGLCIILFVAGIVFARNVAKSRGQKIYDGSRLKGFRYSDQAFKIPSRLALENIWAMFRLLYAHFGGTSILDFILYQVWSDRMPFYNDQSIKIIMIRGCMLTLLSIITTPSRRRRLMAFLTTMVVDEKTKSAASIAALIGGVNASNTLELARTKFRSILLNNVRAEDFDDVKKSEGNTDALLRQTVTSTLGKVDVFISHSWHDHGRKKFKELEDWKKDFTQKNGREPSFWLDKACIDQADIATNLLCLPIFVGGCQKLLIMAGKTYIERLWCVLEIFVFLQMGGTIDQIDILPFDQEDVDVMSIFEEADINNCKCFLESDKQLILGIIQQGYGSFDAFNEMLRNVFKQRTIRVITGKGPFASKPQEKYEVKPDAE